MVVYPIYPTQLGPDPPDMVTLTQGLRKGVRLNDTGMVSQVHVKNPLDTTVLVGESDVLIGPTQLRSVQFSCLVPPHRRASLPVSCVEAGQPTVYQAEFTDADACPWYVRSFKTEQLAKHGEPHQHRLWDNIRSYLNGAGAVSKTHDVRAVFGQYGADVNGLSDVFPPRPGQVGVISAVGQDLFLELFGDPEIFEDRYDQVLKSALVEAVAHPTAVVTPTDHAQGMLGDLVLASKDSKVVQSRSLQFDSGRSLVFSSGGISGSALLSGGRPVHPSAHKRCWGYGRPFDEQVGVLETGQTAWAAEQGSFVDRLERDYSQRRRRYKAFKESLAPSWESSGRDESIYEDAFESEDLDSAPQPIPLNPGIHQFFLRLFRK